MRSNTAGSSGLSPSRNSAYRPGCSVLVMISSPIVASHAITSALVQPFLVSTSSQSQLESFPQRVSAYHSSGDESSKLKIRSAELGSSEHSLGSNMYVLLVPAKVSS